MGSEFARRDGALRFPLGQGVGVEVEVAKGSSSIDVRVLCGTLMFEDEGAKGSESSLGGMIPSSW